MEIKYQENSLTPQTFIQIRKSAGWGPISDQQAQIAVENTTYSITALHGEETIGVGRLIGDGAIIWYIQDIVITPEYQGKGIGKTITEKLIEHAKKTALPETTITIGLMSAKGKDQFYQKLGFRSRPNEKEGSGMVINIKIAP